MHRAPQGKNQERFVAQANFFGLFVLLGTEILSLFRALRVEPVLCLWLFGFAALVICTKKKWPAYSRRLRVPLAWPSPWLLPALLLLIGVGLSGLLCVPNNWDAMVYHLPRVLHWAERASVSIYPTHILYQAVYPAWAQYLELHLYLLFRSDRLFFLVQFCAWLGCGAHLWLWAEAQRLDKITVLLLAFSLPMGILQASSTQTDLVAAFWSLQLFAALWIARSSTRLAPWLHAGIACGLLLSTKSSGFFYAAALATSFLLFFGKELFPWRALLVPLLAFLLNFPFYLREYLVFGSPLPVAEERIFVASLDPRGLLSNFWKNLILDLNAPFAAWNSVVSEGLLALHSFLGIAPADPRFTLSHSGYAFPPAYFYEDFDGNTLCFLLLLAALPLLRKKSVRAFSGFFFLLFFSGIFYLSFLRWSPWHARYHLALFLMAIPGLAFALSTVFSKTGMRALATLLCLAALPYAYANRLKPLVPLDGYLPIYQVPPQAQYFAARPDLLRPYQALITELKRSGCRSLALLANQDSFEYPLWPLLNGFQNALSVTFDEVRNPTAQLADLALQNKVCAHIDLVQFKVWIH